MFSAVLHFYDMRRYNEICIIIKAKYARIDRFLKNSGRLTHIITIVSRKREETFSVFESIVESAIKVKKERRAEKAFLVTGPI